MTVRLLGVGAAAPAFRVAAADIGAAWGRTGRGQAAVCAPDEDMLTLGWEAATRAPAAAGAERGTAALGTRLTRTRPFLDRYRGDGELDNRDLYDARLFREEMFLPVVGEVVDALASFDVQAWSLPDPDGRLGTVAAKRAGAATPTSASVYAAIGDAGAATPLIGGALGMDAPGIVA